MNIIIIDSNSDQVRELIKYLNDLEHSVLHVTHADQALAMVRKYYFEVIMLELTLEQMEIYHIITDLKFYNAGTHIITMTESSTPDLERRVRELGITFYMGKPIDMNQLKQILDQLVVYHSSFGNWEII